MRHLLDPTDLTLGEIDTLINRALDIIEHRSHYAEVCRGKKLATLFYEPSTRTRLSFTAAMMELGGNVLGFSDAASSSVSKGETVADTVRVVSKFADIIAMRTPKRELRLSVLNIPKYPLSMLATEATATQPKRLPICSQSDASWGVSTI